jgi:hypothetical protein
LITEYDPPTRRSVALHNSFSFARQPGERDGGVPFQTLVLVAGGEKSGSAQNVAIQEKLQRFVLATNFP